MRKKKDISRKRPEEFIEYGKKLSGRIDILLLHDLPYAPEYEGRISRDKRTVTVAIAIYEARPRIVFCGHLHISPYTIHRFEYVTLYIRIDTSQKYKCYAILHLNSMEIEIWGDLENLTEVI